MCKHFGDAVQAAPSPSPGAQEQSLGTLYAWRFYWQIMNPEAPSKLRQALQQQQLLESEYMDWTDRDLAGEADVEERMPYCSSRSRGTGKKMWEKGHGEDSPLHENLRHLQPLFTSPLCAQIRVP